MSDRRESPWYCPGCEHWVGWKLDECIGDCERDRPRWPLYHEDVEFDDSHYVTARHRLRAKIRGLVAELRRAV